MLVCVTSCHVTHHAHGYGETQGVWPETDRRRHQATMVGVVQREEKTPTASPGTAGQPHQETQCHHIGPTPPHTGNRLNSHQCQRGTGNQSHHGNGAHPAHHSNRHCCAAHTHAKPPKCRSRVGREWSWKHRHLSQIGEGVRLHTETVCVSVRCTRDDDGMLFSFSLLVL